MTTRRKRIAIWTGAALTLLLVIGLAIGLIKPARDIKIIVDGKANQRLTARFVADGAVKTETVTIPFERSFKANRLSFWLIPVEAADSEINLQIRVNDVPWWPSNSNTFSLAQGVKGTRQTPGLFQIGYDGMAIAETSREEIASIGYHEITD